MTEPEPYLIYDGECPFCSRYVAMTRLREAFGPLRLIDAREGGAEVEDVLARGYRIDDGMVMVHEGRFYHGADCLNRLALMSTRSRLFNRVNAMLFRSAVLSRIAYPVLRAGRNTILRLMGRSRLGF